MNNKHARAQTQKGSVIAYILVALFLMGVLTMALTDGPKQNASTAQLNEFTVMLKSDIDQIESMVNSCVLIYSEPIDRNADNTIDSTDNPNAPFPLIYDTVSGYTIPVTGDMTKAICPAAPPAPIIPPTAATRDQLLLSGKAGRSLQLLSDTTNYTTTYVSDGARGVYIRITRNNVNALWSEGMVRVEKKFAACKAAIDSAEVGCTNGCLYYFFKRPTTSTFITEADCTL